MTKKAKEYFHPDETAPISEERLRQATRDYQVEVMRDWFFRHFENPANNTPYESAEGGYIYIWGGPYDGREELESEFGGVASKKAITALVEELESECYEWSGKPTAEEYDDNYYDVISSNTHAHENLINAQTDTMELLEVPLEGPSSKLLLRLLFVNVVTALETFLSDVFINAVSADRALMKKFVAANPDFRERKFSLGDIFDCYEKVEKDVRTYLLDLIWHNLPKVKEMYKSALDISFPETMKPLYSAISKRHHIVHRNGYDKEGKLVSVTEQDVEEALRAVKELADHVDAHFKQKIEDEEI